MLKNITLNSREQAREQGQSPFSSGIAHLNLFFMVRRVKYGYLFDAL
jgi:hypothetical protein